MHSDLGSNFGVTSGVAADQLLLDAGVVSAFLKIINELTDQHNENLLITEILHNKGNKLIVLNLQNPEIMCDCASLLFT